MVVGGMLLQDEWTRRRNSLRSNVQGALWATDMTHAPDACCPLRHPVVPAETAAELGSLKERTMASVDSAIPSACIATGLTEKSYACLRVGFRCLRQACQVAVCSISQLTSVWRESMVKESSLAPSFS
jgi:hypothetical protein